MRAPTACEAPSVVMFGMSPEMSAIDAWITVSPWAALPLPAAVSSAAISASCPQLPPKAKSAASASVAVLREGRMLLLLRGGRGRRRGSGHWRRCGRGLSTGRRGRHDGRRALVTHHGERERGDHEGHGDHRRDLAEDGRSAHRAEDRLAAAATESRPDVGALAGLEQHHADDDEADEDVDDHEKGEHARVTPSMIRPFGRTSSRW